MLWVNIGCLVVGVLGVVAGVLGWVGWRAGERARAAAASILVLVSTLRDEVRAVEENIVFPRLALNLSTGRLRGLRIGEEIVPGIEQMVTEPDPSCTKCWGRGWTGINIKTKLRELCRCALKR